MKHFEDDPSIKDKYSPRAISYAKQAIGTFGTVVDIAADAAAIDRRLFTSGRRRREYEEANDTFTQSLQLAIGSAAAHCYDMGRLEGSIATLKEHDGTLQLPGQIDAEAVTANIQPALPGL